ncbi:beta-ketoacyl synthase N-terminal-like domain-containing protein [Gynuella sp.]|uniref:beta-ketoacyl synthase N-terminal-like domain-containing protein n=1 Tax=Gynuella sp. TaxID=2969146 RepID=UPI003D13227C
MEKIAILGIGCLFPGNTDKDAFWQSLLENQTLTGTDSYADRIIERGQLKPYQGDFDDCHIDPTELNTLGEIYKWNLAVARDALKDCGYLNNQNVLQKTGMVMGTLSMPVKEDADMIADIISASTRIQMEGLVENSHIPLALSSKSGVIDPTPGFSDSDPPSVTAKALGLGGPVFSFNAACATPLYSFKLASYYLQNRLADVMIAGSHCYNELVIGNCGLFDLLGVLCENGESRPLDKSSKGLIAGSGAGAFVLKRLDDAIRDNDPILAVVESIGWSNDGGSKAILAPSREGQTWAFQDAYRDGVTNDIDYIECHATGTRAGDLEELESIAAFFNSDPPLIGATKGTTGHFFTGSANASITKIILAMKHGIIPAALRIDDPVIPGSGTLTAQHYVRSNTPWPAKERAKRAGVNAFGFGGINAHLVLREFIPAEHNHTTGHEPPEPQRLAITGLGLRVGSITSTKAFFYALAAGRPAFTPVDEKRWRSLEQDSGFLQQINFTELPKGAYVNEFDFDFLKFKLPPKDNPYLIRRDLLLLDVAAQALESAQIDVGQEPRTAVIVNCTHDFSDCHFMGVEENRADLLHALDQGTPALTEAQKNEFLRVLREIELDRETPNTVPGIIPNIRANRISAHWKFQGPSFIVIDRENGFTRATELARFLLAEKTMDAVVIGTVDFAGELEHLYVQKSRGNLPRMLNSGVGEGATAVVLRRPEDAIKRGDKIYAFIDGMATTSGTRFADAHSAEQAAEDCLQQAVSEADIGNGEIGYLEAPLHYSPDSAKRVEQHYTSQHPELISSTDFETGSLDQITGYTFTLSMPLALIKNALQLFYRVKFPANNTTTLRPWISGGQKRVAAMSAFRDDGNMSHLLLSEAPVATMSHQHRLGNFNRYLLTVTGIDEQTIHDGLTRLHKQLSDSQTIPAYGDSEKQQLTEEMASKNTAIAVLCGNSYQQFISEIEQLKAQLPVIFQTRQDWQSKAGSYFSPAPFGPKVKSAWMSPPGRMINHQFSCDLLYHFPFLRKISEATAELMDTEAGDKTQFTRSVLNSSFRDYFFEFELSKMTVSVLKSMSLKPDLIIGASVGELVLPNALDGFVVDAPKSSILISELPFLSQLDSYTHMLKQPSSLERYFHEPMTKWESWYVKAPLEQVQAQVDQHHKVFISIIGSPKDVIIAGESASCQQVIEQIDGFALPLDEDAFVHTPVAEQFRDQILAMEADSNIKVNPDNDFDIFNSFDGQPLGPKPADFQSYFANILTRRVDFRQVTENAYQNGARIFINVGTNELCARWASETLKNKDALVLSFTVNNEPLEKSLFKMAAALISHKQEINFGEFFADTPVTHQPTLIRKITTGLPPYGKAFWSPENRQRILHTGASLSPKATPTTTLPPAEKPPVQDEFSPGYPITHTRQPTPPASEQLAFKSSRSASEYPDTLERFITTALVQNAEASLLYQKSEASLLAIFKQTVLNETSTAPAGKTPQFYLWDYEQIVEMTDGSMSKVLGPLYEPVDAYPVRARMPSPPFLFVTRVLNTNVEFGRYQPCQIEFEFDLNHDNLFRIGDEMASIVFTESGQIGIFLVGLIGIDITSNGKLRYRVADTMTTFIDRPPKIGETMRGVYKITSFARNGDTTLLFSDFDCYHEDRLFLRIKSVGGFFTKEDIENSKGLAPGVSNPSRSRSRSKLPCYTSEKSAFTDTDMTSFYTGNLVGCFGNSSFSIPAFSQALPNPATWMLDRILTSRFEGGQYGLGEIIAEKDLPTDHWAFDAHFKNDSVFPGSMMILGINQLFLFLAIHSGLYPKYQHLALQTVYHQEVKTSFRGQIKRMPSTIKYHMHIKDVEDNDGFTLTVDTDIICNGKIILRAENYTLTSGQCE